MSLTKAQFDTQLKSVRTRGKKVTEEFAGLVTAGVQLYWGETNHNIQVINDLVGCARELKGIRLLGLVEYLDQVVPHHNSGKKDSYRYGKMDQEKKLKMHGTWEGFIEKHPNWHEYTVEKSPAPWDWSNFTKTVLNKMIKAHEKGEADDLGLVQFKQAMSKFTFEDTVPEGQEEQTKEAA